ncbi:metallophosphoesterase family protein [Brevibacillus sp. NPDC058079]|uniref:metallophosphoesterase family protein n=1 Tax=Brevibacillus sp. NPDC058079 TaxID=3346330 RepID=UPI0036E7F429
MKALVLSDLQGIEYREWMRFLSLDSGLFDIILFLGDIDQMYLKVITEKFPSKPKLGVLGNHDFSGDLEYFGIENIHGKMKVINGIAIAGVEGSIKYKKEEAPMLTQEEATIICEQLPKADLLISHNSPYGIHDKSDMAHEGFMGLRTYISQKEPKYLIHGHQHSAKNTRVGNTDVIGIFGGVIFDLTNGNQLRVLEVLD